MPIETLRRFARLRGTSRKDFRAMVLTERARVRQLRERVLDLRVDAAGAARYAALDAVVREGAPLERAVVDLVRAGQGNENREAVRAFCHALMDDPARTELGHLGMGVYLVLEELYVAGDSCFAVAGRDLARQFAPVEYFLGRFAVDADAADTELVSYLAGSRPAVPAQQHLALLTVLAKYLRMSSFVAELEHLVAREDADPRLDAEGTQLLRWFQTRTEDYGRPAPTLEPGVISLAVMDYKLLDHGRTSSNRGDYVQTLAALGNVCRFSDVEFVGDGDLSELLTELQRQVRPDRRLPGLAARVRPVALDRDFSSGREYPENTWLLCNGWFMHRNFRGDIDFPFPESVNPLFVSFHLNDPDLLDQALADKLKRYEPIGCRDWTSVYRLADFGVKAFFSGCLTSTVGLVMPPPDDVQPDRVAVVETLVSPRELRGRKVDHYTQVGDEVRGLTLVGGVRDARAMLRRYLRASRVYTSRLHCYLPARSMGLDVDFRPKNPADIRLEGLTGLDDGEFRAMRTALEDRLAVIFASILSGQTRDVVMRLWRELAAPDVAYADRYRSSYPAPAPSSIDVPGVLAQIRGGALTRPASSGLPGDLTLAFAIDQNLEDQLAVVLQSVADTTSRRVDVHLMGRGLGEQYLDRLHALLPAFSFTLYDFGLVDYGEKLRTLSHITVSTMDRLFLPELLADVDRVVYLDADILVMADVAELFDLDLDGAVIAGKQSNQRHWRNAVRMTTRASLSLPADEAWVLRRRMHHTHRLAAPTFNAGVLVMDLATMRAERFTERYVYLGEHCAFNDQDILNVYANGRVRYLDPAWNHVPNQDQVEVPKIIHWAGPVKPWGSLYTWHKPLYDAVLARVR